MCTKTQYCMHSLLFVYITYSSMPNMKADLLSKYNILYANVISIIMCDGQHCTRVQ